MEACAILAHEMDHSWAESINELQYLIRGVNQMHGIKNRIAVLAILFLLISAMAGCGITRNDADDGKEKASGDSVTPGDPDVTDDAYADDEEYTMPVWAPFIVDSYPESPLEGFLYEGTPVLSAAAREAAKSSDKASALTEKVRQEAPHYPFAQVPLIEPDMLVSCTEHAVDETISVSVMYYTKLSFDEALEFYRSALKDFDRYNETEFDTDSGTSYNLSFSTVVDGGFKMDAGVMVMRMPENTGYECCISFQGAIRGAGKKEREPVGFREDGLPENFPDHIVPVYKVREILMTQGDTEGCYIQFDSEASFDEAVEFYRAQLSDLTDFSESGDDYEAWFYCLAPGWSIRVLVVDYDGYAYIEIECYVE
jgi:hypothetical protein